MKDAVPVQGSNGVSSMGIMKMIGLMKSSKSERQETLEVNADRHKKLKVRIKDALLSAYVGTSDRAKLINTTDVSALSISEKNLFECVEAA